jgi:3-hydroxyisobutyrate dehydrogenase
MVAVVGLGKMGAAMLRRLVARGADVLAHDIVTEQRAAAAEAGARVVGAPGDAAAPIVLLSLPDAAAVASVLDVMLPRLTSGAVIADTSTLDPLAARRFASRAAEHGVAYCDTPVSGGPAGAAAGTLTVMAGGEAEALDRARPVLEMIAARILHVGGPGAGQVAKLVNNLLVASHLVTAAEALRLGARAGVPAEALLAVVNAASGRSAATEVNWPRWIASGAFDSGFTTGLMRKDVRLALALAEAVGAPLDTTARAAATWAESPVGDAEDFNRVAAALFGDPAP